MDYERSPRQDLFANLKASINRLSALMADLCFLLVWDWIALRSPIKSRASRWKCVNTFGLRCHWCKCDGGMCKHLTAPPPVAATARVLPVYLFSNPNANRHRCRPEGNLMLDRLRQSDIRTSREGTVTASMVRGIRTVTRDKRGTAGVEYADQVSALLMFGCWPNGGPMEERLLGWGYSLVSVRTRGEATGLGRARRAFKISRRSRLIGEIVLRVCDP